MPPRSGARSIPLSDGSCPPHGPEAAGLAERWQSLRATEKRQWIRKVVAGVAVTPATIEIGIRSGQLAEILQSDGNPGHGEAPVLPDEPIMALTVAARLKRTVPHIANDLRRDTAGHTPVQGKHVHCGASPTVPLKKRNEIIGTTEPHKWDARVSQDVGTGPDRPETRGAWRQTGVTEFLKTLLYQ